MRSAARSIWSLKVEQMVSDITGAVQPIQVRQLQQAGHNPGGLSRGQFEQNLDREVEMDRPIREHRRAPRTTVMRRKPGHLVVQPDKQLSVPTHPPSDAAFLATNGLPMLEHRDAFALV